MKTLNLNEMEMIKGGKFWGTGYSSELTIDLNCESGWAVVGFKDYYVMGIRTSHEEDGRFCVEA